MRYNICLGLFADDLTCWAVGRSISVFEFKMTQLIAKIASWNKNHNMEFSTNFGKHKAILFTNIQRQNSQCPSS